MVAGMLMLALLVLVRLVQCTAVWACFSFGWKQNDLPIDFVVWLLNSNDHAIALAAQKIANKATGDAVADDHSRSKCIELILATGPIHKSVHGMVVFEGQRIYVNSISTLASTA